ncbi:MauE/DoxX family redox-associated membrane protein [Fodinicola acaciae]|uniref:MauE/DoxX family redox-associated membrane protein n=1 Tax=Fodinicola acaciae TaxID=2681555 RepID=UPI0013D38F4C|nr:MauE/DoxX family redox-associated membrane protein [Fodinicola acaciae]
MDDLLAVVAIALAAVLIVAGASKLAAPGQLADSARAVLGMNAEPVLLARAAGAVELAAAVLVSLPGLALPGAVLGMLVGLGIAGWVALALRRRVTASCGCFGGNSRKPLGMSNLLAGLGIAAGFGLLIAAGGFVPSWGAAAQLAAAATCALSTVLVMRFGDFYPLLKKGLGAGQ